MRRLLALLPLLALPALAEPHIVFLAGGRSHGPGEHEFNAGCQLLAKALREQSGLGVRATVISGWPADESVLDGAKTVVIYADGTSVVGKGLEKMDALAKMGVGMVFMHYAVHPSPEIGEKYFRPWIGGAFESGWSVNPHWVADLQALPNHPVSRGVTGPVEAYDEFYYNMRFPADRSKVLDLATAIPTRERMKKYINLWNEHGVAGLDKPQTLMWGIERPDGGRGVGFTGGHYHRNWAIDGFRTLVLNAIVWSAGIEVPAGGVKSLPLTEDDLNANLDDKGKKSTRLVPPKPGDFKAIPTAPIQEEREKGFGAPKERTEPKAAPAAPAPAATGNTAPLFTSPLLTSAGKPRVVDIDVDLAGARELHLVVSDEGSKSCDWAAWLEPTLVMADGSKRNLTELKWTAAKAGSKDVKIGKSHDGRPVKVEDKEFANSLGTHAPSHIAYALPEGAKRFVARAAIDDGGMIRQGKPSDAALRFLVFTQAPSTQALAPVSPSAIQKDGFVPPGDIVVPDDLEVTLWASSPMLYNPTNMDTDEAGRIWVAEGVNYRKKSDRRPQGDRIVVLEDTDRDGKADRSHVFVQDPELVSPLGVSVFGNRVVVAQPPHLIVYTDVDGDLKFDPAKDKRENLLTGFFGRNHDHSLHAVVAGPDGQWYFNQGNTGAEFTTRDGKTYRVGGPYQDGSKLSGMKSDDGRIWTGGFAARMQPDGTRLTMIGHGFRNSYEHTVASNGDVYQNDNDDPPACRVSWVMEGGFFGFFSRSGLRTWQADRRIGQSVPQAHWRQDDPGTQPPGDVYGPGSPTGIATYENGALPAKYANLLLSAEARQSVIFGYHPQPDGAGKKLERFDFMKAPAGRLFRPSDVMVGADGAVYVADWYDTGVGGHGTGDDTWSGAIYRVAPKGFRPNLPAPAAGLDGAVARLRSPAINVRHTGFTALRAAGPQAKAAVAALMNDPNSVIRQRAAWLLPFTGNEAILTKMLSSTDAAERLLAFRVTRNAGGEWLDVARALAKDPDVSVRREVAAALRFVDPAKKLPLVSDLLATCDGTDRMYLEACGLAAEGIEAAAWEEAFHRAGKPAAKDWSPALARLAWRLQPVAAISAVSARAQEPSLPLDARRLALDTLAFTRAKDAMQAVGKIAAADGPLKSAAIAWLFTRAGEEWKEFGGQTVLRELGIYDPAKVTVQEIKLPAEAPKPAFSAADVLALQGDAARGKLTSARCVMCHQIDGNGPAYGPELRGWAASQGAPAFVQAVLEPSATIAHGFDGTRVELADGREVNGLLVNGGDPLVIQSMGGLTQFIPSAQVAKKGVTPLRTSLMLSAAQLGLTAQDVADLGAFFAGYR